MLIYVLVGGRTIAGSKRWIDFGFINFQPSELAKISIIIVLAKYFSENHKPTGYTIKDIIVPFIIIIIPAVLILKEPDLGTSLITLSIFFTVLIFVGLKLKSFINIMLVLLSAIPVGWFFILKEYQKDRIRVFLDPESDKLGDAWHITQSVIAIGSGKLFGKGYLSGTQTKLEFVPKQHTDFIFSVFSEEWGFVGCLVVIILFLLLSARGIDIASKSKDRFGAILAVGSISLVFWQAFINMGMELNLLPVVGITLPFFSYGGSAMLVVFIAVAMLANVSMRRHIF
jgi:rod shape determining protein RodA